MKNLGSRASAAAAAAKERAAGGVNSAKRSAAPAARKAKRAAGKTKRAVIAKHYNYDAATSSVLLALHSVVDPVKFVDLSPALQNKFMGAGLRGGQRSATKAAAFYENSVPDAVKMLGPDAINDFLAGKDASHIESVANAPHKMRDISNIKWEPKAINRARGSDNMTGFERVRLDLSNGFEAFAISARQVVPRATLYAAAAEAAVSIVENGVYVYRGHKTIHMAVEDSAVNSAKAAAGGLLLGIAVSGVAAAGGAAAITVAAPALGVIGGALLAYSAARRVRTALIVEIPAPDAWRGVPDDAVLAPLDAQLLLINALKEEIASGVPTPQSAVAILRQ